MDLHLDLQLALDTTGLILPSEEQIHGWISSVLSTRMPVAEITVRIVDEVESEQLNQQYRHKQGPTNVLSFPFEADVPMEVPLLGDIVICAPVVIREAVEQHKDAVSHWAHMLVHGTLHLLGFDHHTDAEADAMEQQEIQVMQQLGFSNPYEVTTQP
ncbi:MAG: rRNA maturation RNase YbeY [Gammaproteobacteria bacterium]|nr:rRNA maturation RNase YbeY [Gammaproteobacteria bacterium]